ncbi:uncharacterized protein PGTG_01238 [Puccinia graminis f. sp. tritici CRL 75-36-700-3]|uniref:Homeodomain-like DNA binding domain-containing transcription factor n=1 Tax=Puccinia graminis f. sp. tritici (strain CRL 75-36-700-3 / race SCCL) TaxID=418459 RepID=E3JV32_PUCGT|nr:uncharacterized protein PGTG_01238 [Puccinia graminis f. sp. tritici CRL 75-36-700-3]EFP75907.1 hypothetical protein PGTG_01238 [Puccinia graminis f. sp. tritici CRL 75-36-700-3]
MDTLALRPSITFPPLLPDASSPLRFDPNRPSIPTQSFDLRISAPASNMPYQLISPGIKIAVVRMVAQGYTQKFICETLGEKISKQSFARWVQLYRNTQRVIRDTAEYEKKGPGLLLTTDDQSFMIELLRMEPGLFLDEIRERLYDETDTLLIMTTLHRNLVEHLEITLKKANTVNIKKSLVAKYAYMEKILSVPAEFLVFSDKSCICSRDLLRAFSRSSKGKPANRTLIQQNTKRFTLLPAISVDGIVALTVTEENVFGTNFAHFLKYILLSCPFLSCFGTRSLWLIMHKSMVAIEWLDYVATRVFNWFICQPIVQSSAQSSCFFLKSSQISNDLKHWSGPQTPSGQSNQLPIELALLCFVRSCSIMLATHALTDNPAGPDMSEYHFCE